MKSFIKRRSASARKIGFSLAIVAFVVAFDQGPVLQNFPMSLTDCGVPTYLYYVHLILGSCRDTLDLSHLMPFPFFKLSPEK